MKTKQEIQKQLEHLFEKWSDENVVKIIPIALSGSNRKYYRIQGSTKKAVGVFNDNKQENHAFFSFTNTFIKAGLAVPELYSFDKDKTTYLLQDLGDQTLFDLLLNNKKEHLTEILKHYKNALRELIRFQILGKKQINFNDCYPCNMMDKQSFLWDLNYFKYYFLKPQNINFDEQKLEDDFHQLTEILQEADHTYFLFRDFQARNIMIYEDKVFFIDYQGGRKGALQYDLASLLYQVKANLSSKDRKELLAYYCDELELSTGIAKQDFIKHFYPYVFIRLIQVMGAYGFRGLIEKKSHFIESIPFAITTLKNLIPSFYFLDKLPELHYCIRQIVERKKEKKKSEYLKIEIKSFAYKAGIPKDDSGHGEGFVFDCRALPNPGSLKEYKQMSGLDNEVIIYLKKYPEVNSFLDMVYNIVSQSIDNYIERSFTNLNINFGCTGGQHRSVYCAESLKNYLTKNYQLNIKLEHTQKLNWKNP
jgi:aminoglycoside/choline kinase family phosphotransferase